MEELWSRPELWIEKKGKTEDLEFQILPTLSKLRSPFAWDFQNVLKETLVKEQSQEIKHLSNLWSDPSLP